MFNFEINKLLSQRRPPKVNTAYSDSRKEYYERRIFPQNVTSFSEYNDGTFSKSEVNFKGLPWGTLKSNVIRLYGIPRYSYRIKPEDYIYEVIFYKERLENMKTLVQLHFINDYFFYACYTFKENNKNALELVKTNISNKYGGLEINTHGNKCIYIDANKNKIIVTDSVYMHVGYLSGSEELFKMLNTFQAHRNENERKIYNERIGRIRALL